jgi:hypothetical protein
VVKEEKWAKLRGRKGTIQIYLSRFKKKNRTELWGEKSRKNDNRRG